ncbi:MAG: ABC transporter ATP-binding protein [Salinivirgaceae bacterium]
MKYLKQILKYVFPKYWKNAALNFLFILLMVVFGLFSFTMVIPFLQVLFNDQPVVTNPVPFALSMDAIQHNFNYYLHQVVINYGKANALLYVSIFVVIAVFFKTGFWYAARYVMAPLRVGAIKDIRNKMYSKILGLPLSYFSEERKGDIISRMTNDLHEVEASIIRSIDVIFKEPISIIISLGVLIYMSPQLTLFVLVLLPVTGFIIGRVGSSLRRSSMMAQNKLGDILSLIDETLGGLRIIKAFVAEKKMDTKFRTENQTYASIMIKMWRRRDLAGPLSEFLGTVVMVLVLWYGGRLVLEGGSKMSGPGLIGFIVIFSQIINPAKAFSDAFYNIQKGIASSERIDEIMIAMEKIVDAENAVPITEFKSSLKYNNIFFRYKDEFVINGITLEIEKGKTVALVGQSGSGKSTLVDLLPRFYDVNQGSITIDGIDVKNYQLKTLRKLMGVVNQESILFNDTIFNNIAFGVKGATMEQVVEAAKIANAHEFISEMTDGYESNIGDRGSKLSGGQRQRLSIARAILANPPIMILDEATSALDTESEKLVQESLTRLMENRTSIVIAHRLSTVIHADLICVIHEGKIVEQGTHRELIEQKGYYKKLHDAQMFA